MRVIEKGKEETYQDFYPGQYEFKLCGGSVEPKDRVESEPEAEAPGAERAPEEK